jgi:2-hydroxy-3-keto-5-methylthiopentenyl-1-phosphate phosphatase
MPYTPIKSFTQIIVIPNSLVVLDIDETVIKYDSINQKWWRTNFDALYDDHKDHDKADKLVLDRWLNHIHKNLPEHTDTTGFDWLLNQIKINNSDLIFLTARTGDLKAITEHHLSHLKIHNTEIYFSEGRNKGVVLNEILQRDYPNKDQIIFADDMEYNLDDVKTEITRNGKNVALYQFVIE